VHHKLGMMIYNRHARELATKGRALSPPIYTVRVWEGGARQSGERGRSTTKTAACDTSDATPFDSRTFFLRGRFFEPSKLFIHACM
jgi:hypothetical protein